MRKVAFSTPVHSRLHGRDVSIAIGERCPPPGNHHPGAAADLPVETLNHVVCADAGPILVGNWVVSQGFSHTVLYLFAASFGSISRC